MKQTKRSGNGTQDITRATHFKEWLCTKSDLIENVDLSAKDLRGITLDGIKFSGVNFSGCNLTGANLSEAIFEHCLFTGATLFDTCFCFSGFTDCDFTDAQFGGTDFAMAQFESCKFGIGALPALSDGQIGRFQNCRYQIDGRNYAINATPISISGFKYKVHILDDVVLFGTDAYAVIRRQAVTSLSEFFAVIANFETHCASN